MTRSGMTTRSRAAAPVHRVRTHTMTVLDAVEVLESMAAVQSCAAAREAEQVEALAHLDIAPAPAGADGAPDMDYVARELSPATQAAIADIAAGDADYLLDAEDAGPGSEWSLADRLYEISALDLPVEVRLHAQSVSAATGRDAARDHYRASIALSRETYTERRAA